MALIDYVAMKQKDVGIIPKHSTQICWL